MSEAFPTAVSRLNVKKYIDQIQDELAKIMVEVGPGKTAEQVEAAQARLDGLRRKQAQQVAKELGLQGNHILVFGLASTLLTTAFVSFYINIEIDDLSKPFDERLVLTDMLNSMQIALGNVITSGTNYAEVYGKK